MHAGNSVAVIAAHSQGAQFVYPSHALPQSDDGGKNGMRKKGGSAQISQGLEMDCIDRHVHAAIMDLAKDMASHPSSGGASMVSAAFAMAACR